MKMLVEKNAVVFGVLLLVILQPEVEPQPTVNPFEGESCSQLLAKTLPLQPVTISLIQTFSCRPSSYAYGVTAMLDKIYVLCQQPNLIKVFENRNQYRFLREIALNATKYPFDIVYSDETKCLYIGDAHEDCIWEMTTTNDHRLTKWLTNASYLYTLALSTDGQLLKMKSGEAFSELIIYDWNASVVLSLNLSEDIKDPRHAVQTSTGNFILSHRLNDASNGIWVISQLNNVGQLIHRFIPRNKFEELDRPYYLCLDSEDNRLYVADVFNHRVILFDSTSLIWRQVLLTRETHGIDYPYRLFYDVSQRRLIVAQFNGKVDIYEFEGDSLAHL